MPEAWKDFKGRSDGIVERRNMCNDYGGRVGVVVYFLAFRLYNPNNSITEITQEGIGI